MNQKDILKEQLKSAFSDFEAPIPKDGWERMEQSLNAVARTKIVRRNWYIGSAAATVVILLGSLFFLKSPQTIEQDIPTLAEEITSDKIKDAGKQDVQVAKAESTVKSDKSSQPKLSRKKQEILIAEQTEKQDGKLLIISELVEQEDIVVAKQPEEKKPQVAEEKINKLEEKRIIQPNQEEIDRLIQEFENTGNTDIFGGLALEEGKSKPVMLALNARGGLTSSQKTANSPMTLRSASADKSDNIIGSNYSYSNAGKNNDLYSEYENMAILNNRSIAGNVAEMDHNQPISFGITVSKTIIDRLSIETGLVYTYLYSKAKNTSIGFQNQETQHFYYLGIPVNINYNFVNIGRLGLFASLGGMIEKDIYGKRQYQAQIVNEFGDNVGEAWTIEKINQNNPQISINAGLGVFYPIYGRFNLYGKIGGAYYFDAKNNYKTIYSDRKIVLDLNAGIRFDF